jgi:hypothetical protein
VKRRIWVWSAATLIAAAASSGAHAAGADDVVRTVDRPFVRKPAAAPAQPAFVPGSPRALAPPAPSAASARPTQWSRWSLQAADGTVDRAFERWARERKVAMRWLVGRDLPVDAGAESVTPELRDFELASAEGSVDPELAAAMMKVARAFWNSKSPFSVREYDNTILVLPRSENRP